MPDFREPWMEVESWVDPPCDGDCDDCDCASGVGGDDPAAEAQQTADDGWL